MTVLLSEFGDEQWFLAAGSDLLAAFPEAPLDFGLATWCRESDPDLVASLDRQVPALVAASQSVPARVRRSLQRRGVMPESPA